VHNRCVRGGYYEEGNFATTYGTPECLVKVGCWGPVVQCNIVERGAIRHHGGCMNQGGICIGCTMPGFPDKFSPFYKKPPGSTASSSTATFYGKGARFLRGFTQRYRNREKRWDRISDVPSGWARQKESSRWLDRFVDYLYAKVQHFGVVEPGRKIPETKYRDGWEVETKKRKPRESEGEMKWGQARRRAKIEREAAAKKAS
jgi:hydrogenase small subunit